MEKALGVAVSAAALLALGGCAIPPIVTIASYSADAVSYAASGKTITDHVWSYVARSDCSFIRIIHAKPICVDETNAPPEAAPPAQAPVQVAREDRGLKPVMVDDGGAAAPAPAGGARDSYVVLGSFSDTANAERARAQYASYHPSIFAVLVHGRQFHRVVAGPLTAQEAAALRRTASTVTAKPARG